MSGLRWPTHFSERVGSPFQSSARSFQPRLPWTICWKYFIAWKSSKMRFRALKCGSRTPITLLFIWSYRKQHKMELFLILSQVVVFMFIFASMRTVAWLSKSHWSQRWNGHWLFSCISCSKWRNIFRTLICNFALLLADHADVLIVNTPSTGRHFISVVWRGEEVLICFEKSVISRVSWSRASGNHVLLQRTKIVLRNWNQKPNFVHHEGKNMAG